jgi:hypothetical protein
MVLLASSLFLLFSLLQQLPLVLLLVVALIFWLEYACHAAIAQQLRVRYTFFNSLSLILLHLLSKGIFHY